MRTHLFAALAWLIPAAAWAQAQPPEEDDVIEAEGDVEEGDDPAGEDPGADVPPVRRGDRVRMAPGAGDASAPGEVHTVVPGDTLWDLSQQYLGSPWYWPKVWSYNPEIANPHWIYPGNRVKFFAGGEEVPVQVEAGQPMELPGDTGEVAGPDLMETGGGVTASGKIGYTPPTNAQRLLLQGFITARELEEAGQIAGSFSEALMLSYPDTIYVRFKNRGEVQVGGEYLIFKTVKKVDHPVNGGTAGYLTHFLGRAKVVKLGEMVTAQITETWDEIQRGDLIGPANEKLLMEVAARPNEREMKGFVIEMLVPYLTISGEHQIVLVDRGGADGVQVGNAFTVVRNQDLGGRVLDPVKSQDMKWPEESIATCLVVDVKDRASTCLLTRSIREVMRGDRVVMRAGGGAPAASAR